MSRQIPRSNLACSRCLKAEVTIRAQTKALENLVAENEELRKFRDDAQAYGTRLVERNRALNADVAMLRDHANTLDRNWQSLHELSMGAIRQALGMPDATVPELVREIERREDRLSNAVESAKVRGEALERAEGDLQDADTLSQDLAGMFEWVRSGIIKFLEQGVEPKRPGQAYEEWSELDGLARLVGREV